MAGGRAKPVERAFRDLCAKIDTHPRLAGSATGRSTSDRPETHRSKAAPWQIFIGVVTECVIAHNAHRGRRTEIAAGQSFDDAWAGAMAGTVVRKISDAQARVLMLSAEPVKVGRDGAFHLNAGRVPHRPPNRYHDPVLVEHAGEVLVARFDPDNLHGPCLVYDREGRWLYEAACLLPVGFADHADVGRHERARRQMDRANRKAVAARRDMDALLDGLAAAGPPQPPPVAEPVAVRLVTGPHLPEAPSQGMIRLVYAGCNALGLDEEARRALQRRVTGKHSLGGMSAGEIKRLIGALRRMGFRPPSDGPRRNASPLLTPRRRSAFMAALKTVQQMEEDDR